MNGKILLDTNAIINALNGGLKLPSADYYISIITEMELFSYPKLTEFEKDNITMLLGHFEILSITEAIKDRTIETRKNYGIKLPDSIICATALEHGARLISNDGQLSKIKEIKVSSLEDFINMYFRHNTQT